MNDIPTWHARAMCHPDHQSGMVSEDMLRARMTEEIVDLRAEVDRQRAEIERLTRERDEARAEVERLRGTIRQVALAADGCISRDKIVCICHEALEAKP